MAQSLHSQTGSLEPPTIWMRSVEKWRVIPVFTEDGMTIRAENNKHLFARQVEYFINTDVFQIPSAVSAFFFQEVKVVKDC